MPSGWQAHGSRRAARCMSWSTSCAMAAHSCLLCCLADMPSMLMQSGMVAQYGANQYASQQAAAPSQAPITMPARPQQATQVGTFYTTSYSQPSAQPRMTAAPAAAAPAFGRPSVQAPAGSRASAISRPSTQSAAAKPALPTASAGKADLHRRLALSQQPRAAGGRAMTTLLIRLSKKSPRLSFEGSDCFCCFCTANRVGT